MIAAGTVDDGESHASRRSGSPLERAVADRREAGGDEPPPVVAEVDEERQRASRRGAPRENASEVDERVVPPEQVRDEDQVPRRGDRQELGEPLHDAHDQGLDELCPSVSSGRPGSW